MSAPFVRKVVALVAGFAFALACGETLPSADDGSTPPRRADPDSSTSEVDDEPPAADSGSYADVVGIEAAVPSCAENGLVARWKLDEGTGVIVGDCSGNGNHGLVQGQGPWIPDAGAMSTSHSALGFDGTTWVGFGNQPKFDFDGAFTVTAWVRGDASIADTLYVVGKTKNPADEGGWRLGFRGSRAVTFGMAFAGAESGACYASGGSLPAGKWGHVAGVFRPGQGIEAYADGVLVEAETACVNGATKSLRSIAEVRIGARSDDAFGFLGAIDDVRIYARDLSGAELAALAKP